LALPFAPTTLAQRLAQALGPEHLLIHFRTYREYPTEEKARWRIIELLEVGFRPRRVAALLAIDPHVVYYWSRRFKVEGLLGLSTRPHRRTPITTSAAIAACSHCPWCSRRQGALRPADICDEPYEV
jgi:transposase-like protein